MGMGQNLVPLVNIKIAGKWMFIPLKMVLIGIDPYAYGTKWGPRLISKLVNIIPMSRTGLWYENNELVTGANLNQRSHHWGASHCTYLSYLKVLIPCQMEEFVAKVMMFHVGFAGGLGDFGNDLVDAYGGLQGTSFHGEEQSNKQNLGGLTCQCSPTFAKHCRV